MAVAQMFEVTFKFHVLQVRSAENGQITLHCNSVVYVLTGVSVVSYIDEK